MKVNKNENYTYILDTEIHVESFLLKIENQYDTFKNENLILDLSFNKNCSITIVNFFKELAKSHQKNKKSFVLIIENIDFNKVPKNINVVPTIVEAIDIIELEEIERDLGF